MPEPTILEHSEAPQWNKALLLRFQTELEINPNVDLLTLFPTEYVHAHRVSRYGQLPYLAKYNLRTWDKISDKLRVTPELNMLKAFPRDYETKISWSTTQEIAPKPIEVPQRPDIREYLDNAQSASVIFPLSESVSRSLALYSENLHVHTSQDPQQALSGSLKALLWNSQLLWQGLLKRAVLKCGDVIVAKIISASDDYTECTSMQYLAKHAANIPAPRPHGLIEIGYFNVIFMSFVPGITLTEAWSGLGQEGKVHIQGQLNSLFSSLRQMKQDEGKNIGEVNGDGLKELRVNECVMFKGITTSKDFEDLQFSAKHNGSKTFITLLRSLIDSRELHGGSVFTHGDVRTDNIMVIKDATHNHLYNVAGIIDWEDSGFYPTWHECTTLARTMSVHTDDDWYNYIPTSISPSNFPTRWLVDLIFARHLRTI